jgi:hypothetical protein
VPFIFGVYDWRFTMKSVGLSDADATNPVITERHKNSEEKISRQVPSMETELFDRFNQLSDKDKKAVGNFLRYILDRSRKKDTNKGT